MLCRAHFEFGDRVLYGLVRCAADSGDGLRQRPEQQLRGQQLCRHAQRSVLRSARFASSLPQVVSMNVGGHPLDVDTRVLPSHPASVQGAK